MFGGRAAGVPYRRRETLEDLIDRVRSLTTGTSSTGNGTGTGKNLRVCLDGPVKIGGLHSSSMQSESESVQSVWNLWLETLKQANDCVTSLSVVHPCQDPTDHDNDNNDNDKDQVGGDVLLDSLVSHLTNLTVLKITGNLNVYGRNGMPLKIFTRILTSTSTQPTRPTGLTQLHLTSVTLLVQPDTSTCMELESFSLALAKHESLQELRLQDCQINLPVTVQHESFLHHLFKGVSASQSLRTLFVQPTNPRTLGNISIQAIHALHGANTLASLTLYPIHNLFQMSTNANRSPFQALMDLLIHNQIPNLKHVQLPFLPSNHTQCQAIANVVAHNSTLSSLHLQGSSHTYEDNHNHHHQPNQPFSLDNDGNCQQQSQQHPLVPIATALSLPFSSQKTFQFSMTGPGTTHLPAHVVQEFANTVQLNYAIQQLVLYDIQIHPHLQPIVHYHCRLNQQGRRQWLQHLYKNNSSSKNNNNDSHCNSNNQQASAGSGIHLLTHLAQEKDALFYYLSQINPALIEHQQPS